MLIKLVLDLTNKKVIVNLLVIRNDQIYFATPCLSGCPNPIGLRFRVVAIFFAALTLVLVLTVLIKYVYIKVTAYF